MADIVAYLNARNSAREGREGRPTETARLMRAVYMLSDDANGARTVVDAATISDLVKAQGKGISGGLRCEHGHVMKFVDSHMSSGSAVCAYFAHVTKSDEGRGGGGGRPGAGTGRCSDVHLAAQLLIKNNISRIVATRFKSCGECTEFAFQPTARGVLLALRAEIEVSERTSDDRRIRSDVVVYKNDERCVSFEVKHTHATGLGSRAGLPYLEVSAGHVVSQFENCAGLRSATALVRLKCENATTPCTGGCAVRRMDLSRYGTGRNAHEPATIERIRAAVDAEYAQFRDAQDALDTMPTTPEEIRALLEKMEDSDGFRDADSCVFYSPTPYPNGKAHGWCEWESIPAGSLGVMAKSMADDHEARDKTMRIARVTSEMEAICDWFSSNYEFELLWRHHMSSDSRDASEISFDSMYDLYLGAKPARPVCKSVNKTFFAKSVFYNTAQCPKMDEAGEVYYYHVLDKVEITKKVDGAYAEFRAAQDDLDATPTPCADMRGLLEEMANPDANETAFCCYTPTPYPNGKARCLDWESILGGMRGELAKSAADDHQARDEIMRQARVTSEISAICDWWFPSDDEFTCAERAASRISFDSMYDLYLGGRPVCKSVTNAFFAKSIFCSTSRCPEMDEAGTFCYSVTDGDGWR
jgi:hypothetical protein